MMVSTAPPACASDGKDHETGSTMSDPQPDPSDEELDAAQGATAGGTPEVSTREIIETHSDIG